MHCNCHDGTAGPGQPAGGSNFRHEDPTYRRGVHAIRWLDLDGVLNMRDVGGMPTVDGGQIRPGRLIRSDSLQHLSAAGVRGLLEDLGVTDVVDLRTHVELAREGAGPLHGDPRVRISHFTLYADDTAEGGVPAGERELPWTRPPTSDAPVASPDTDHDAHWSGHYLGYLAQRPENVVAALRAVAAAPGAVVVHCAAGKDRTGTVTALALTVAGAQRAEVLADFARSAERVPLILARLKANPAYASDMRTKTVTEQSPRAETMALLLDTLDRTYGGPLGWLAAQGWTGADTTALRAKLLD